MGIIEKNLMETRVGCRYKLLDIVRLACAGFVVIIHMGYGDSYAIIPCLTRQAVPFFFLASGFFFQKRLHKEKNIMRYTFLHARKVFFVYLFWVLCWLPGIIRDAAIEHTGSSMLYLIAVIIRRIFFAGLAPYWYLLVLAEGILLLAVIVQCHKLMLAWFLCITGVVLGIVFRMHLAGGFGNLVYKSFYTVFSWDCNLIMTGFPLLFLGATASRFENSIREWNLQFILLLYLVAIVLAFFLHPHCHDLYGNPFGIFQALFLFAVCLISEKKSLPIPDGVCVFARNLSAIVFLTHTVFLTILGKCFNIWNAPLRLMIILAMSILLLVSAIKINWKPLNRVLMIKY